MQIHILVWKKKKQFLLFCMTVKRMYLIIVGKFNDWLIFFNTCYNFSTQLWLIVKRWAERPWGRKTQLSLLFFCCGQATLGFVRPSVHPSVWVLHIAKVAYFSSSSWPNVEWLLLWPLPFFFYQKSFIFRFLENCFWEPNLYIAVG